MVADVNGPSSRVVKGYEKRGLNADKAAGPERPGKSGGNRDAHAVTLTDLAARLQQLTQSLADIPAVDRQRVEDFRKTVANGTYALDTQEIAEKLAAFEMLLQRLNKQA
jgi:flagellar biosynthesis anti-sigma factor FlgM